MKKWVKLMVCLFLAALAMVPSSFSCERASHHGRPRILYRRRPAPLCS